MLLHDSETTPVSLVPLGLAGENYFGVGSPDSPCYFHPMQTAIPDEARAVVRKNLFINSVTAEEEARATSLWRELDGEKPHYVYWMPGAQHMSVRMTIGGKPRCLAFFESRDYLAAFRFADMAILRLGALLVRKHRMKYNLSEKRALVDTVSEPAALARLEQAEAKLLEAGVVPTQAELDEKRAADWEARRKSRQAGQADMLAAFKQHAESMKGYWLDVSYRLNGLQARLDTLLAGVDAIQVRMCLNDPVRRSGGESWLSGLPAGPSAPPLQSLPQQQPEPGPVGPAGPCGCFAGEPGPTGPEVEDEPVAGRGRLTIPPYPTWSPEQVND